MEAGSTPDRLGILASREQLNDETLLVLTTEVFITNLPDRRVGARGREVRDGAAWLGAGSAGVVV